MAIARAFARSHKNQIMCDHLKFARAKIEKKRTRNSLTDSPRKSLKKMLFVTITLSWTKLIECKKCFENRAHPDYKKHIWSRNVKQHYSKCKFGCNSPEGVTLFVKIVMWMLRPLFHLQMNHYIWCVFIMFVTMVMKRKWALLQW